MRHVEGWAQLRPAARVSAAMALRSVRSLGLLATAFAAALLAFVPARAAASNPLVGMFEDQPALFSNPVGELSNLRLLGVTMIRFDATWSQIAPAPNSRRPPRRFNAANPAAYPAANWRPFDAVIRAAQADGIQVNLDLDGALSTTPLWAVGPGSPRTKTGPHRNWEPNARLYGLFARAVATRYRGTYVPRGSTTPLPRVSFWSIWNEPNYGPSLAPQALPGHPGVEFSPLLYRNLVDAAWTALAGTGHGHDSIIFGEVAPRGSAGFGQFNGMKPLPFLRALYCLDSRYRPLRGSAARLRGCPGTARGFAARHPGLFKATAFSDHPYMRWYPPNKEAQPDPGYSSLGEIRLLERALDRVQLAYGSHRKLPIYDTEFGYITTPPKHDNQIEPGGKRYPWPTQATAAYYLNWAEYISWRDPRIVSFDQYLLADAVPANKSTDWGGFASGLLNYNMTPKPTYAAWRIPLYMPVTSGSIGQALEVWGCVRPAPFAALDTGQPQSAEIQFQPSSGGPFTAVQTVNLTSGCYFDLPIRFPGSGAVRIMWSYPSGDPRLSPSGPLTATSRSVQITLQ
jgi:hypothetical protein